MDMPYAGEIHIFLLSHEIQKDCYISRTIVGAE